MEKKVSTIILSAFLALGANAAEWQKPVPTKFTDDLKVYQQGDQDTTFYYLYLQDNGFLTAGNAYRTQASVGLSGHKIYFSAASRDGFDGTNVVINDYFPAKGGWKSMFIDSPTKVFMDRGDQPNYFFGVTKQDGALRLYPSELNPDFKSEGDTKYYFGLDQTINANTTALTANIDPNSDGFTTYTIDWRLVSDADYNGAYKAELDRYNAAQELRRILDDRKTKHPDIDFSQFEAVYENTNSTLAQLQAAINNVDGTVLQGVLAGATEDNPINLSKDLYDVLGISYDFENKNIAGWTSTTGSEVQAANNANGAADPSKTGNHYENWSSTPFSGRISATAKNFPAGLYKVQGLFFAVNGSTGQTTAQTNTYFFANDKRQQVNSTLIDESNPMSLSLVLTETGDITYGLDITTVDQTNWVGMDNVTITYYGKITADPDQIILEDAVKSAEAEYPDLESVHANKDVKTAYQAALDEAKAATGNYAAESEKLNNAIASLRNSVNDYKILQADIDYAHQMQNSLQSIYPELAGNLDDLIMEWEDQYNELMEYKSEDIAGLKNQLNTQIAQYISEHIKPGDDITALLQNSGFDSKDLSGWTMDSAPNLGGIAPNTNGSMAGTTLNSNIAEYYHAAFNIRQVLPSLPAGVYKYSCQGFTADKNSPVYLYAQVPGADEQNVVLPFIDDYATTEQLFSDGTGWDDALNSEDKYVPKGMPGANYHFNHDEDGDGVNDYTVSFNVVFTQQTDSVVVGLRSSARRNWAAFDNFRLVYLGQNLDAYKEIVDGLKSEIANVLSDAESRKGLGADAEQKITEAEAAADAANSADAYLKAIDDLKAAIEYAHESTNLYEQLNTVLDKLTAIYSNAQVPGIQSKAENYIGEVSVAADEKMCTNDEAKAKIAEGKSLIIAVNIPANYAQATETAPVDFTAVIPNHDLESTDEYFWITEKPRGGNGPVLANGINGQSMEYWVGDAANGAFNYYQSLGTLLPTGYYELSAKVANSYSDLLESHPEHATTDGEIGLYAVVASDTVKTLVPTQTALFTESFKEPKVIFHVTEGKEVMVGVKSFAQMTAHWTVMDDFTLNYLGTSSTGIESLENYKLEDKTSEIYDLQGRKLNQLQRGINIIRTGSGKAKKVVIK